MTKYGADEFFGNSWIFRKFVKYTCGLFDTLEELCSDITMLFVGTSTENWNQTRVPVYLAHTPAGSSSNLMAHFVQMFSYGGIPAFDMGEEKNLKAYGQKLPPQYNFTSISDVPIYLFWSEDDWMSTRQDLKETLFAQLDSSVFQVGQLSVENQSRDGSRQATESTTTIICTSSGERMRLQRFTIRLLTLSLGMINLGFKMKNYCLIKLCEVIFESSFRRRFQNCAKRELGALNLQNSESRRC